MDESQANVFYNLLHLLSGVCFIRIKNLQKQKIEISEPCHFWKLQDQRIVRPYNHMNESMQFLLIKLDISDQTTEELI